MRKLFTVLALLLASSVFADDASVLRAIAMREGVKDPAHPKTMDSLGAHQFKRPTWEDMTTEPFIKASTDPVLEQKVAEKYLKWIHSQLIHNHIPDDTYHCALCWNAGWGHVLRNTVTDANKEYAQNVVDIEATLRK